MPIVETKPLTALLGAVAFLCLPAGAGNMSSMTYAGRLDNGENPSPVVAGESGSVEVKVDPAWFGADSCALYVDGELAAESSGGAAVCVLPGSADGYLSYKLTLEVGGGRIEKFVTVFPDHAYRCRMHALLLEDQFLDSRPAGTVRRWKAYVPRDVAWSTFWNGSADRALVSVYRGTDTSLAPLATLVDVAGIGRGYRRFLPEDESLGAGTYTLTHFDGVETLSAYIDVTDRGTCIILK